MRACGKYTSGCRVPINSIRSVGERDNSLKIFLGRFKTTNDVSRMAKFTEKIDF